MPHMDTLVFLKLVHTYIHIFVLPCILKIIIEVCGLVQLESVAFEVIYESSAQSSVVHTHMYVINCR